MARDISNMRGLPDDEVGREVRRLAQGAPVPILGQQPQFKQSQWICPTCKDIPMEVPSPNPQGIPPGTPESQITQLQGEPGPTFLCMKCQIRFLRKYCPALVLRSEYEMQAAEIEEPDDATDSPA